MKGLENMVDPELAGRWQRLGGSLVDGLIFLVIEIPIMVMFGVFNQIANGHGLTFGQWVGFFALHLVVFVVINAWLLTNRGQTIGKKIVGIKIVDLNGALRPFPVVFLVRYALIGVIGSIPIAGSLFCLLDSLFVFRKDKRCIHDLMAGTLVVKVK